MPFATCPRARTSRAQPSQTSVARLRHPPDSSKQHAHLPNPTSPAPTHTQDCEHVPQRATTDACPQKEPHHTQLARHQELRAPCPDSGCLSLRASCLGTSLATSSLECEPRRGREESPRWMDGTHGRPRGGCHKSNNNWDRIASVSWCLDFGEGPRESGGRCGELIHIAEAPFTYPVQHDRQPAFQHITQHITFRLRFAGRGLKV